MVVSVVEASANPYYNCFEGNPETGYLQVCKGNGQYTRRQDAPQVWEYNGAVYVINPKSLRDMPMGQFFGVSFFFLLFIAAITSIISVFESVVSFGIDCFNISRKKSVLYVSIINVVITVPAVYSFSTFSNVSFFGQDIITFEDFVSSNIFMVLGSLIFAVFCYSRYGWGINNYMAEINEGHGIKLPNFFRNYLRFVIPVFILIVFVTGIMS
jgi:NSS family neurotransmitter:Na+ symporter